jgi:hypothetical protein
LGAPPCTSWSDHVLTCQLAESAFEKTASLDYWRWASQVS